MLRHRLAGIVSVAALATALSYSGSAAACRDTVNELDNEIMKRMACSDSFVRWTHNHFDLREWRFWGQDEPCVVGLPYSKMVVAGFLLARGLGLETPRPTPDAGFGMNMQFHGGIDYAKLSHKHGDSGRYHRQLYFKPSEGTDNVAAFQDETLWGWIRERKIVMYCGAFDSDNPNGLVTPDPDRKFAFYDDASPAGRTATILHESTHAMHAAKGTHQTGESSNGHIRGSLFECSADDCDWFFHHHPDRYAYDTLDVHDRNATPVPLYHSAYQVEVEYNCDLVLYGQDIPSQVISQARVQAEKMSTRNFLNIPPFVCNRPGMWSERKR